MQEELESSRSSNSPEPLSLASFASSQPPSIGYDGVQVSAVANDSVTATASADDSLPAIASGESKRDAFEQTGEYPKQRLLTENGHDYNTRPPNILVYTSNNDEYYESVKKTLQTCIDMSRLDKFRKWTSIIHVKHSKKYVVYRSVFIVAQRYTMMNIG